MTTNPLSESRALTLPPVQTTKPFLGNSRCSFQTCSLSWSSMLYLLSVDPPGSLLTDGIFGEEVYHFGRSGRRMGAAFLIQRWYTYSLTTPMRIRQDLFSQTLEALHHVVATAAEVVVQGDVLSIQPIVDGLVSGNR